MKSKNLLFYFGVLPALFFQFIGAYVYFVLVTDSEFVQPLYFGTKVLVLVWPLLWWIFFRKFFLKREKLGLASSVGWGLFSGFAIIVPMFILFFVFQDFFQGFAVNFRAEASSLGVLDNYILFAAFLSLFHAFLEEYYWRWFIFGGLLSKMSEKWAILITAVAFASHHFIVLSQFFPWWITILFGTAIAIGSVIWSILYLRTGRLLTGWISHVLVDVAVMTIGYFVIF